MTKHSKILNSTSGLFSIYNKTNGLFIIHKSTEYDSVCFSNIWELIRLFLLKKIYVLFNKLFVCKSIIC